MKIVTFVISEIIHHFLCDFQAQSKDFMFCALGKTHLHYLFAYRGLVYCPLDGNILDIKENLI